MLAALTSVLGAPSSSDTQTDDASCASAIVRSVREYDEASKLLVGRPSLALQRYDHPSCRPVLGMTLLTPSGGGGSPKLRDVVWHMVLKAAHSQIWSDLSIARADRGQKVRPLFTNSSSRWDRSHVVRNHLLMNNQTSCGLRAGPHAQIADEPALAGSGCGPHKAFVRPAWGSNPWIVAVGSCSPRMNPGPTCRAHSTLQSCASLSDTFWLAWRR